MTNKYRERARQVFVNWDSEKCELWEAFGDFLEAEAAKEDSQSAVDGYCHYRNLAIKLGATPDQMLCQYDRKLALNPSPPEDDGGFGEFLSQNKDLWDEIASRDGVIENLSQQIQTLLESEAKKDSQIFDLQQTVRALSARDRVMARDMALLLENRLECIRDWTASAAEVAYNVEDSTKETISNEIVDEVQALDLEDELIQRCKTHISR